uniref:Uncharacterized protein n=1 Tax=Anguilla anguilla TaxID=7936 RepID=A0A0E9S0M9_ANGAN
MAPISAITFMCNSHLADTHIQSYSRRRRTQLHLPNLYELYALLAEQNSKTSEYRCSSASCLC